MHITNVYEYICLIKPYVYMCVCYNLNTDCSGYSESDGAFKW